jgi:hypothetical protein
MVHLRRSPRVTQSSRRVYDHTATYEGTDERCGKTDVFESMQMLRWRDMTSAETLLLEEVKGRGAAARSFV